MRAHLNKRLFRLLILVVATITLPVAGATSPVAAPQNVAPAPLPAATEAALRPTQSGVLRTDPVRNDSGTVMLATLNTGSFPAYVLGAPTVPGPAGAVAAFRASPNEAILAQEATGSDGTSPSNWEGVISTFLLLGFFLARRAR